MISVRGWVAVAATLPLLVVAGCSEDPEPKFSPPSESPSASESSEPPAKEAWEVKSEAGAIAFAKHWVDVLSEAMRSGDTRALRVLSDRTCDLCDDFADRLDRITSSGGFYRSEGWDVLRVLPVDGLPSGQGAVTLRVRYAPEELKEESGSNVVRNPGGRATWSARMSFRNGWTLTELELLQ